MQTGGANKGADMIAALEGVTTYTAARYRRQPALQCNTSGREAAAADDDGQRGSAVLAHPPSKINLTHWWIFTTKGTLQRL